MSLKIWKEKLSYTQRFIKKNRKGRKKEMKSRRGSPDPLPRRRGLEKEGVGHGGPHHSGPGLETLPAPKAAPGASFSNQPGNPSPAFAPLRAAIGCQVNPAHLPAHWPRRFA